MAEEITPFSITAPGFFGCNTQDAPVDMDSKFALEASNCVIDKYGRIGSRKGWVKGHSANSDLGTASITTIGELVANDGTRTILAAGNGFIFKLVAGTPNTLVTLTYGGGGVAPTISANDWQFATMNSVGLFFQRGYDPLIFDPATSATTFRRMSEHASYAGSVPQGNCILNAYGRVWTADTSADKNTVTWSDTLTFQVWTGGTAGSLNLLQVWPQGGDEIVALGAHNGSLIIFGTKQILIYGGADDPSTMKLTDSISSTGCAGRDTVQNTAEDIIYLSDTGIRSLRRTIQEKSAPIRTLSRTVNNDIQGYLDVEGTGIKSAYSPIDALYLLTFVSSNVTYCFDTRTTMEDGSARATTWTGVTPRAYAYSKTRILYMGVPGYLGRYEGYLDDASEYRMTYYTPWIDFGNPVQTSILKKITMTLLGASNQAVVYKWGVDYKGATHSITKTLSEDTAVAEYGLAEYGVGEYSYSLNIVSLGLNAGSSGKVIQVGFEAQVQGNPISIQRVDILTKNGRL